MSAPAETTFNLSRSAGTLTFHLIKAQLNYAFSARGLTATTVQYNSVARLPVVNFRLDYIYRPGDDFFLIYNESDNLADSTVAEQRNRSIIAKITHSWDLQFQGRQAYGQFPNTRCRLQRLQRARDGDAAPCEGELFRACR